MSQHQKRKLFSVICLYAGCFLTVTGIILMNIFGYTISDKNLSGKLILVSLIIVIIGFVLLIILTRINANYFIHGGYLFSHFFPPLPRYFAFAGVPNNSFLEFDIPISNISQDVLQACEVRKGIYEIQLNNQNYIFDMRGWIQKRYYIFEIILTKFQTKYMLKGKVKSLCSSLCVEGLSNLNLEFINRNGKTKSFILVQEGKTKVSWNIEGVLNKKLSFIKMRRS